MLGKTDKKVKKKGKHTIKKTKYNENKICNILKQCKS